MRNKLKNINMKPLFLLLLSMLALTFCNKSETLERLETDNLNKSSTLPKYSYYTTSKILNIRESINNNSKVIGNKKKCEKVAIVDTDLSYNENKDNYVKIKTLKGLIGFVPYQFLKFIDQKDTSPLIFDLDYNKDPFDITRKWSFYQDNPNLIIEFRNDLSGSLENSFKNIEFSNQKVKRENFTYIYDGCCNAQISLESGKQIEINIINFEDKKSILMNCMFANPDFGN
ncbi:SH3 domain-containing protein [Leptospira jelokensis]|uniref:SH3 domain-containing protein n=1 Tax=Leptospira jelokensis TaxID=2484931 RepID=UPI001090B54F|nr:SH3 domain-containing protein [Leptospira jelokensis]TGL98006.1 SH3 domain-containing protein [Leptospira jelokensis]